MRAFTAQVCERSALHDAELPLIQMAIGRALFLFEKIVASAACPLGCALESRFGFVTRRGSFDAFIEHHGNVRTEGELNFRGFFRREEMFGTVEVRFEANAVIG